MSLLHVENLSVEFITRLGVQSAVKGLSFRLERGQVLGIVGESGSGKSVSAYSFLGLLPMPPARIASGRALFEGRDLLTMTKAELRALRGNDIAMIFQDPMTSLNPYLTVGEQLLEPLIYHKGLSRAKAHKRAVELLDEVGIRNPEHSSKSYPHEFSGGMRQRAMIAMALISEPKLLIADEPTTALDVSVQAQILALLAELRVKHNIGVIFISHDLAVVKSLADQVLVMNQGLTVETGPADAVLASPQEDYTKALIAAVPTGAKAEPNQKTAAPLLSVQDLSVSYRTAAAGTPPVVRKANFNIHRGEILGLVGESGSGKSTLGRALLRLLPSDSGSIHFDGQDVLELNQKQMRPWRKRMQMIFQDPYASLNPRMTVFDTLAEPLLHHGIATRHTVSEQVLALMDEVGLARRFVRKYAHEFSGGQRQRIAIGRALATEAEFIVADEPVSALDVTIQKQILDLLLDLVERRGLTMLFISHDLAVVRKVCDSVLVMKHGEIVEHGQTEDLWRAPQHEYTQMLLASSLA